MLLRLVGPFLRWLIRWYIERLVCIHFCKFKEAGSDFGYTHVHVLGSNPGGATGLGHDDNRPNNDHPAKVTVSGKDGDVEIGPETDETMNLRKVQYLTTAHFHEARGDECPEGFQRIRCRCGAGEEAQDYSVCYTTDRESFESWFHTVDWPHRVGTHPYPFTYAGAVTDDTPGRIECASDLAIRGNAIEVVGDCAGFGGPGDGANRVVAEARARAQAAADKIDCKDDCARTVTEVFSGWTCEPTGSGTGRNFATAVVVLRVSCAPK